MNYSDSVGDNVPFFTRIIIRKPFKILTTFPFIEHLLMYHFIIRCYVGSAVRTSMSISDGLGLYIFRRGMGKTRPMSKEMDGKVFFTRVGFFVF